MRAIKILSIVLALQGCVPSFKSEENDRLFLKEIDIKPVKLEWFFYSTVSSETPDYITIQKGKKIDTICISSNVADLKLEGNKIIIGFYGKPQKYTEPINVPKSIMDYEVLVDTSYLLEAPASRKFYKKDK